MDDTKTYISFKPRPKITLHAVLDYIGHYIVDIETRMHHNILRPNTYKMEIILSLPQIICHI